MTQIVESWPTFSSVSVTSWDLQDMTPGEPSGVDGLPYSPPKFISLVMFSLVSVCHSHTSIIHHPHSVRRSIQSAVIFEAYRSLEDQLPTMRPFQRKVAVLDQAKALVDAMGADVVPPHQRVEILWRTMSSKEHLDSEAIWKRAKTIEKELKLLAERIQPHWAPGKEHSETVNEYVQRQYVRRKSIHPSIYPSINEIE